jgi:hypothetical protein
VNGFVKPELSYKLFAKAAETLEKDTPDLRPDREEGWSSINSTLWAPYFESRSWLAAAVRDPERAHECIAAAAKCMHSELHWAHPGVHRFRLLVQALGELLQVEGASDPSKLPAAFEHGVSWGGCRDEDSAVLQFIEFARSGFAQLAADRRKGLTTVGRAMEALDRLPLS